MTRLHAFLELKPFYDSSELNIISKAELNYSKAVTCVYSAQCRHALWKKAMCFQAGGVVAKASELKVGVGTAPEIARAEGWVNYRISLVGEPHPLALKGQPALVLVAKDARDMKRHNQFLGFAVNTVACTTTAGAWGSRY